MSDFLTIATGSAVITERFTGELRWLNGMLQQKVSVQTVHTNRADSTHCFEWRDVPTANTPAMGRGHD